MPRVKPGQRKRAQRPKTRSGCATCKIRRVKCDEAKPHCRRCTSTGRVCDGYDSQPNRKEIPLVETRDGDEMSLSITPPIGFAHLFDDVREQRALFFFSAFTSQQMAGFYECDFWERNVLQAAYFDSGIRHAAVALSTLHESFSKTGEAGIVPNDFVLRQYNLAIREHVQLIHRDHTNGESLQSYIAACVMFICIEILQAHYLSAGRLIKGALRILGQMPRERWHASGWPIAMIHTQLQRLDRQSDGLFGGFFAGKTGGNALANGGTPGILMCRRMPEVPAVFSSLTEARDVIESFVDVLSSISARQILWQDPAAAAFARAFLDQWQNAFTALLEEKVETYDLRQLQAIGVLRIRYKTVTVVLAMACKPTKPGCWAAHSDEYHETLAEVVTIAEGVVARKLNIINGETDDGKPGPPPSPCFTLDYGIVGALYEIACGCRDPRTRRAALRVLRAHACREGMWDCNLAVRTAERVIQLEEAGIPEVRRAEDIPFSARIQRIIPSFEPNEQRGSLAFVRQHPDAPAGTNIFLRESLDWWKAQKE